MKILLFLLTLTAYSTAWTECVSGNCTNGTGTYTWPSGNKYVGEWRDGEPHGEGALTTANGNKYVGEWRDGEPHGEGTYTFFGGSKYVGEYRDFKKHGRGTYTYANGDKYVGEFLVDKRHGEGTFTWPSGEKYVGEFRDSKKHGEGTYTYADGRVKVGVWQNDEYFETKEEWNAKIEKAEKHDRIYRACLLDKGADLDMQVTDLRETVEETCEATANDPSWLDEWRYD